MGHPLNLGDDFPNFKCVTTEGEFMFHDWLDGKWAILFSHPADYTPVCTTELARAAQLHPTFTSKGVKLIALSCDSVENHRGWIKDIEAFGELPEGPFPYPIIADEKREIATLLGMLDPEEKDKEGIPLTCRAVFMIGKDRRMKLSMLYPATTGRNFDEILRAVESLIVTETRRVATPANWKKGTPCMVPATVTDDEIAKLFPSGVRIIDVPSGKNYMRITMD
ncbi:peroxiredoxin-6-like [Varroa jacobsoni]|uniref:1-Cys peroxiredoxin n=1 Tax=Varroa destructor TaxID=109461 RepID=A0A7M7K7P2_VARDE|nr:peroxiredoxin-6-like [Varroa destructor]XP_022659002.1 peroxiredoxin-6-like [Varroa destructor]XP_022704627.1 peroxiredoxin-6-like [Varroa jacobsoni]